MDMIKIKKGNITNCVSKGAFEKVYKPLGWAAVEEDKPAVGINQELSSKGITAPEQQLAYIKAKSSKQKMKFTDGLFKGE